MTTRFQANTAAAGLIIPLLLGGCLSGGDGSSSSGPTPPPEPGAPSSFVALFDPASGELPFPTNLAFEGTTDGTLNIPTEGLEGVELVLANQLNDLDGWSTVSPIEIHFAEEVDSDSLAEQIQVLRTTLTSAPTAAVLAGALEVFTASGASAAIEHINAAVALDQHQPLSGHMVPMPGFTCADPVTDNFVISVAATEARTVLLKPLTPLAAANEQDCLTDSGRFFDEVVSRSALDSLAFSNGYVVVVLEGLTSTTGEPAAADDLYAMLRDTPDDELPPQVAPLAALYQPTFAILQAAQIDPAQTVLSFSFSTQSVTHALDTIAKQAGPRPSLFQAVAYPGSSAFQLFVGQLRDVPYYLNNKPAQIGNAAAPTGAGDATSVRSGQWTNASGQGVNRFDPAPLAEQTVHLPVMVTVPPGTPPAQGWPVVIYQHGLTSNRSAVLGLAPLFADAGWAMVAIDHPLHGLLPSDTTGPYMDPANERHFYIDMDGDGNIDSSGSHATPTASPATARDIRRQTVADLLHLTASLDSMRFNGQRLDTGSVGYVGISMGGVIGSMFAGVVGDRVQAFSLNVPGGGMAKMFDGSPVFAAQARPAFAATGLTFGTKAYEDFLNLSQVIEDSGDPINYAQRIADGDASVYVSEMVGDIHSNPLTPPDLVLPNDLRNGPLYNRLFDTLGLSETQVAETAPLSGTTPLWQAMGLTPLQGDATEYPIRRVARIAGGSHYSLHLPARPPMGPISTLFPDQHGPAAMAAVQRQTLELLTSLGTELSATAAEQQLLTE